MSKTVYDQLVDIVNKHRREEIKDFECIFGIDDVAELATHMWENNMYIVWHKDFNSFDVASNVTDRAITKVTIDKSGRIPKGQGYAIDKSVLYPTLYKRLEPPKISDDKSLLLWRYNWYWRK